MGLRLALIGCGGHGHLFGNIVAHSGRGSRIVAVADTDSDSRNKVGNDLDVPVCDRYVSTEDLLERKEGLQLDAAIVSTPASVRRPVLECLESGLHVFCENPLALDVAEARTIAQYEQANERICCVDDQWPMLPSVAFLWNEVFQRNVLGELDYMHIGGKGRAPRQEFERIGTHLLGVARRFLTYCSGDFTGANAMMYAGSEPVPYSSTHGDRLVITVTTSSDVLVTGYFGPGGYDVQRPYIHIQGFEGQARAVGGFLEGVWVANQPYFRTGAPVAWSRVQFDEIASGMWEIQKGQDMKALLDPAMNPTFQIFDGFERACLDRLYHPLWQVMCRADSLWQQNLAAAFHAVIRSANDFGRYVPIA